MQEDESARIERLLADVNAGQPSAVAELTDAVHRHLRAMAAVYLRRRFGPGQPSLTWQPTALVNEAFLRILRNRREYDSGGHFFAIATTTMKRILMDSLRRHGAEKRGRGRMRIEFDPDRHSPVDDGTDRGVDADRLFAAIDRLAALDGRKADVVRMRVLWGFAFREIASSLEVSEATVSRDWRFAKAWLRCELDQSGE